MQKKEFNKVADNFFQNHPMLQTSDGELLSLHI